LINAINDFSKNTTASEWNNIPLILKSQVLLDLATFIFTSTLNEKERYTTSNKL
jgi:hypothetical protein